MPASEIPLGSFWFSQVWKLATVFVLAVAPIVASDDPQLSGPLRFHFVGIIYAVMIVSNEEPGYGHASDDGIYYHHALVQPQQGQI